MIVDLFGGILIPHVVALFLLFRIAMWEVRPEKRNGVRADMARLWAWVCPHWRSMVAHPFYWAATGMMTAYFLIEPLRSILSWQ